MQPEVNHWEAARALDVAGIDIYHPSQDKLTDFRHVAWPQAKSRPRVGISSLDPEPLDAGNAQRLE